MKRRWYAAALLLPALFPVTVISAFVILNTFREGLGFLPELSMYALDLSNYAALFGNRVFLRSLAYRNHSMNGVTLFIRLSVKRDSERIHVIVHESYRQNNGIISIS